MVESVTLDEKDFEIGYGLGLLRVSESERLGCSTRLTPAGRQKVIDINVLGALGEMAFAKWLGVPFIATVNTFKTRPDVGGFEVRTAGFHNGKLIIRDDDLDTRPYVLVTSTHPPSLEFRIHGFLLGKDGKKEKWLTDGGNGRAPAYFVPQSELHSFDDQER